MRSSHADYDDRIFSWDNPPPDGHPGQAYGCRCYAEPLPPSISAPPEPPLPMSDEEMRERVRDLGIGLATLGIGKAYTTINGALRGIQKIHRNAGRKLAQYRAEHLARQTSKRLQEIVMPNGRFIGKKGDGARIREIKGNESDAIKLYDKLKVDGKFFKPNSYKGEQGHTLPNGDWVGFRPKSKSSSPAIDLKINGINIRKIHFVD